MFNIEIEIHPSTQHLRNIKSDWKIKLPTTFLLFLNCQLRKVVVKQAKDINKIKLKIAPSKKSVFSKITAK